jgi:hypothetical protein
MLVNSNGRSKSDLTTEDAECTEVKKKQQRLNYRGHRVPRTEVSFVGVPLGTKAMEKQIDASK